MRHLIPDGELADTISRRRVPDPWSDPENFLRVLDELAQEAHHLHYGQDTPCAVPSDVPDEPDW